MNGFEVQSSDGALQELQITIIGGGPGGLFAAILIAKAFPRARISLYERNRAGETFGWGVVFSDETLGNVEAADPESFAEIRAEFAYWADIETYVGDDLVRSTGHGFCGLGRKTLLEILDRRARALGVRLHYETEVRRDALERESDLVIAADGLNSEVRRGSEHAFRPCIDERLAKFCWLGTNKPLDAFTFVFRTNEHGTWNVHAYPYERGEQPLSTWIVECSEETWRAAGLNDASEAETVRYLSTLFADHLSGYDLMTNRSIWRSFPTVSCGSWVDGKTVLVGDAAHTAHFSIGSGTKLAMEDGIALANALRETLDGDGSTSLSEGIAAALAAYEEARRVEVIKTQKAAQTSLEWFEHSDRYMDQDPVSFAFNLMTRSKRITYENLKLRDPELVERARVHFLESVGADPSEIPLPVLAPMKLRDITLQNRIVVSPMCQYSAEHGVPTRWHDVHYGARSVGGAGLLWTEGTAVSEDGRITYGCTGMWNDTQEARWREIVSFCHENGATKIGMQIVHAGRKASCSRPWEGDSPLLGADAWESIGPTEEPFWSAPGTPAPRRMDRSDMERVTGDFRAAATRARRAGFDAIEIHMAHGYLLSSFLSPAVNTRTDEYGGERLEDRARFPLEVLRTVREAFGPDRPLFVRVSASDWLVNEGQVIDDTVEFARTLQREGCDVVDVSSAGNVARSRPVYGRMYQVPFAEEIKYRVGIPVQAVGAIQGVDHANTVLTAGRADLIAMARPHLVHPAIGLDVANAARYGGAEWPKQYVAAKRS